MSMSYVDAQVALSKIRNSWIPFEEGVQAERREYSEGISFDLLGLQLGFSEEAILVR
ncbi:hypothetical protein [Azospirillum sp. SYSU D00513]|uniref:hypothetical protein n=1 Tax=Azospirillum sp. SYSU D00513 TaxID=2812561 RepID=UPI001A96FA7D|nr:hypothetical protein [Azospirillum sp. SYSU D00513]